ncbi:MAG TPA: DegV family protein [Bacillota bacterium]|nr:DegV family protein [Bacillota bacterium]HOH10276.1 DegV family protein [Bacillota bacterium]HOY89753.1 DegV family protein [Bacillota bacterium]HPM64139.1 DegV family protein [Bacillota bacterium]HQJ24456.1 DegV family protein [Bacillota bacterium]
MGEKIALVTDSLSDLIPEIVEKYKVTVVPISIHFGSESFKDRVDITDEEFFERLKTSDVMPKTSQPTPNDFEKVYKELLEENDHVISLHISNKLSGTVQSAFMARQDFPEEQQGRIHVIDTLTGAMGEGLIVNAAGESIEKGSMVDEVLSRIKRAIDTSGIIWIPGSLKYLQKNGRIGGASALIGSILNIKPLIGCKESVYTVEKIRGLKNAVPKFIDYMKKKISPATKIVACIINNNMPKEAAELERAVKDNFNVTKMFHSGMGAGIGSHIGPDSFGVAWYAAE